MAVKIRLKRLGRKKAAFYRIVVADARRARDGKVIEEVGTYNPHDNENPIITKDERINYWVGVGAQPTRTVVRLLSKINLMKPESITSSNQKISKKDRNKDS